MRVPWGAWLVAGVAYDYVRRKKGTETRARLVRRVWGEGRSRRDKSSWKLCVLTGSRTAFPGRCYYVPIPFSCCHHQGLRRALDMRLCSLLQSTAVYTNASDDHLRKVPNTNTKTLLNLETETKNFCRAEEEKTALQKEVLGWSPEGFALSCHSLLFSTRLRVPPPHFTHPSTKAKKRTKNPNHL